MSEKERKLEGDEKRTCWRMKSNVVHFITSGIAACCLCLHAEATGPKAKVVEKTVATSEMKVNVAAKAAAETKAAAEKGGAEAQYCLGGCYFRLKANRRNPRQIR